MCWYGEMRQIRRHNGRDHCRGVRQRRHRKNYIHLQRRLRPGFPGKKGAVPGLRHHPAEPGPGLGPQRQRPDGFFRRDGRPLHSGGGGGAPSQVPLPVPAGGALGF